MSEEKKLNIPWFKRGDVDAVIGVFFDGFSKIIVGIGVLTGVMECLRISYLEKSYPQLDFQHSYY